jgi:hypothetical protein
MNLFFPLESLKDIESLSESVEPGDPEPYGEQPVTGALAHEVEVSLPPAFQQILDAATDANGAGGLIVGFAELSFRSVTVHLWDAPRQSSDPKVGFLGGYKAAINDESAQRVCEYIAEMRTRSLPLERVVAALG